MSKRIHRYLFYTLIAVVYGVFFSVESFYNFEGHSDARKILSHISRNSLATGSRCTSSARFPATHALRLNKRYQQENFTPCPVIRVEMPVRYVEPRRPEAYPVCPLPFVTLDHPSLRGPPIAA